MARATARIAAMQMIYEYYAGGEGGDDTLRMVYDELREENQRHVDKDDPDLEDRAWIERTYQGVLQCREELDQRIREVSRNWSLERMASVDRTILRLAVWEILHEKNVPGSVVISEAVEMANQYSDEGSGRFINGILGTILRAEQAAKA